MSITPRYEADPLEPTLGERLRIARERAGFNRYEDFAVRTGISRGTVYNYERGKTKRNAIYLRAWAEACGLTLAQLLGPYGTTDGGGGLSTLPTGRRRARLMGSGTVSRGELQDWSQSVAA